MLQKKLNLLKDLSQELKGCDELWVAVALMSDFGFNFIQTNLPDEAVQHYLVGIDLPTSPKVLENLMQIESEKIKSKYFHEGDKFFHPKLYLIRKGDKLVAFVGSGNCTQGGLENNIELSVKTDDPILCKELQDWFNIYFRLGKPISNDFLSSYSGLYTNRVQRMIQDKKEMKDFLPEVSMPWDLDSVDFSDQFFEMHHFKAFEGTKPSSSSDQVIGEREKVKNKLFKLHDKLLPEIRKRGWDLYEHYEPKNIVSSTEREKGFIGGDITGIWVSYGRKKDEIKKYGPAETPLNYMRLQVIVHKDNVAVQVLVGKDGSSPLDRDNLRKKLEDAAGKNDFYSIISALPGEYFIHIGGEERFINSFSTEQELIDFVRKDNLKSYFFIRTKYRPGSPELSKEKIVETIMGDFERLYPIYTFIKHELNI